MAIRTDEITSIIRDQLRTYEQPVVTTDVGTVVEVGDGIARIYGMGGVRASELVQFENGVFGMALNLEEDAVGAVILGPYTEIEEGQQVRSTGHIIDVPVGDALIGRVVDPLGQPLDGKGPIRTERRRPVERVAPGVITRQSVSVPVQTGIKAIDSMIPVGRGQRELIIGDRQVGKSAIAVDTIINQKGQNLICIYVAIGQKTSKVAQIVGTLEEHGAMDHTIVVVASADTPAPLQFISAYAATSMGEEFMESGRDALIVYDDLSKHAASYREVSLLLRRPPGREAYPGDVFYLHSRLLERSARLNQDYGGGSLTALPLIETLAGDVSAYIPTNVISITDGQIYLEGDLFNAGVRPPVNVGLSVSRVGGSAQTKAMRQVAGRLRLELSQYRELAAFAQFGSDLDSATRHQLERGQRIVEILKQPQFSPMSLEQQVLSLYAVTNGYLDDIPVESVRDFESKMQDYMASVHPQIGETIRNERVISDQLTPRLRGALDEFKQGYRPQEAAAI